jgi:hypothetical protein
MDTDQCTASQGGHVKRTTVNFILDLVGFLNLLALAGTGSILRWVLPPGSGGGYGRGFRGGRGAGEVKELLGLARHDWGSVHFGLAVLCVVLMLVHIILHWSWIKTCGKSILFPSRKVSCDDQGETQRPIDPTVTQR